MEGPVEPGECPGAVADGAERPVEPGECPGAVTEGAEGPVELAGPGSAQELSPGRGGGGAGRGHWCEGTRTVPGWGRRAPTRPSCRPSAYSVIIVFLKKGYQIQILKHLKESGYRLGGRVERSLRHTGQTVKVNAHHTSFDNTNI